MKKKLQPVLTLLQHYMAQDMTVYAGHATLFLLTAFFPLLMWLLVVVKCDAGVCKLRLIVMMRCKKNCFSAFCPTCLSSVTPSPG